MPDTQDQTTEPQSSPTSLIQPELQFVIYPRGPLASATEIPPPFTLTRTGIIIPDDLTENNWRDGLKLFKWAQTSLKLGFASYIAYGTAKFGRDKVSAALGQLEFDMPTVTQAMDINTVPDEIRYDNLTADHYIVLARSSDLTKAKKADWSRIASEQNLTPPQLKASIAAGEVVSVSVTRQQQHGIIGIHGIRQELDIWLNRVGGIDGILKMDQAHQDEILGEIERFADLYAQIKAGTGDKKPDKKPAKAPAKKVKKK